MQFYEVKSRLIFKNKCIFIFLSLIYGRIIYYMTAIIQVGFYLKILWYLFLYQESHFLDALFLAIF